MVRCPECGAESGDVIVFVGGDTWCEKCDIFFDNYNDVLVEDDDGIEDKEEAEARG